MVLAWWPPGRTLIRVAVGLLAAYIDAAMLAYVNRAGAMDGQLWSVAMVLWGRLIALPVPRSNQPNEAGTPGLRGYNRGQTEHEGVWRSNAGMAWSKRKQSCAGHGG